jgi:diketogulonate reductase-like aldo/keto reductase
MNHNGTDLRTVRLHNGVTMPTLAFGCAFGDWVGRTDFQGFLPEQAWRSVSLALDNGYRAFDGARVYGTERIVGTLLGQRFASGELTREELFITTKLAHPAAPPHVNISHRRTWDADKVDDIAQRVRDDMADTLDDLGLGYVDLLLMHWPGGFGENTTGDPDFPRKARATIWRTFCELADKGAARAIGASHFTIGHLRELMEDIPEPDRRPTVNQVEFLLPRCGAGDLLPRAGHRRHRLRPLCQRRLRPAAGPGAGRHRRQAWQEHGTGGTALARPERPHRVAQDKQRPAHD